MQPSLTAPPTLTSSHSPPALPSHLNSSPQISHITSVPAIIMPVKDICAAASSCGCRVIVDGAHALGQVPLSYSFYNRIPLTRALGQLPLRICDMGCDYYVANCHKWMLCCRGSGFMYGAPPSRSDFM
jgi:isopenicillin-N epimerase